MGVRKRYRQPVIVIDERRNPHHGTVKDTQGQMRHADPTTTLRYYVKVIPENQRKAVADFERSVMKTPRKRRSKAGATA